MPALGHVLGFPLGESASAYTAVFDHDSLRDRLLIQFRRKPLLNGLLQGLLRGTQDVEDVAHDLLTKRLPDAAEGAQVDVLGAIRGVDREGRTDGPYLLVQHAFVVARKSSGTIPDLYAALEAITPGGQFLVEDLLLDPASIMVRLHIPALDETPASPDDLTPSLLVLLMHRARTGGVRMWFEWWPTDVTNMFKLCAGNIQISSTIRGLADNPATFGGYLAGMEIP